MTDMVGVIWPDGHLDRARTWRALERKVRAEQWHRYSPLGFRLEMRERALLWSGIRIPVLCRSRRWFKQLERAGGLRVLDTDEEGTDGKEA